MKGIKISDEIEITEHTTLEELEAMLRETWLSREQRARAIRVYGKFQAKKVRYRAIEIVQEHSVNTVAVPSDGLSSIVRDIQNIESC